MGTTSVSSTKLLLHLWISIVMLLMVTEVIQGTVTYDKKAILINGQRRILISGSIHYPRSTPDVCFHISSFSLVCFVEKIGFLLC